MEPQTEMMYIVKRRILQRDGPEVQMLFWLFTTDNQVPLVSPSPVLLAVPPLTASVKHTSLESL